MPLSEHVYCVAVTFKLTNWLEQRICIRFCIKFEHSSLETIQMIRKATAMGSWWLAASSQQCAHSCVTSYAEFFGKTSHPPADSAPLQPRFGALPLLAFPQTKVILWKGRNFISEIRDNTTGLLMVIGRTVWGPKVPTLRGPEVSLSYVQRSFLYLVSSSVNISIFHIIWLDTFWTDLAFCCPWSIL